MDLVTVNDYPVGNNASAWVDSYCTNRTRPFGNCQNGTDLFIRIFTIDQEVAKGRFHTIPESIVNSSIVSLNLQNSEIVNYPSGTIATLSNLSIRSMKHGLIQLPKSLICQRLNTLIVEGTQFSGEIKADCWSQMNHARIRSVILRRLPQVQVLDWVWLGNSSIVETAEFNEVDALGAIPEQWCRWTDRRVRLVLSGSFSIVGSIPNCMSNVSFSFFDIANTSISGQVPNICSISTCEQVFFTNSLLTGTIPRSVIENTTVRLEVKSDLSTLTGPYFDQRQLPTGLHPSLTVLIMRMMNLTGTLPEEYGRLRNLTILRLGGNFLTGTFPDFSGTLLTDLELSNYVTGNNSVGGELFSKLPYQAMRFLLVEGNRFEGVLPPDVGVRFNRLTSLNIANNAFFGTLPPSISLIRASTTLRISGNNFTGCLPPIAVNDTIRCYLKPISGSYQCCPAPAMSPPPQICDLTACSGEGQLPIELTRFCPLPRPGASFICVDGEWATSENVQISGNSTLTVAGNTNIIIAANLTLASNTTLQLSSTSTVQVSECATLSGNLELALVANATSSKTFSILTSDQGCLSGNFSSFSYTVEGCGTITSQPTVTYTSAAVLISFDYDASTCNSASGVPSTSNANGAGDDNFRLIIGAVVGGVLGLVIIIVVVILIVPAARYRVFPFLKMRNSDRVPTNPVE